MVYLININETNLYKIGISTNVKSRFNQLSRIIPYDLTLIKTYKVNHDAIVESLIHKHYKDNRIKGEWFKLKKDDIVEIDKLVPIYDVNKYNRVKYIPKINPKFNKIKEIVMKIYELEEKYSRTKGIGDTRRVVGNELGISEGTITKLKKINRLKPILFEEIEKGEMTISSAYLSL